MELESWWRFLSFDYLWLLFAEANRLAWGKNQGLNARIKTNFNKAYCNQNKGADPTFSPRGELRSIANSLIPGPWYQFHPLNFVNYHYRDSAFKPKIESAGASGPYGGLCPKTKMFDPLLNLLLKNPHFLRCGGHAEFKQIWSLKPFFLEISTIRIFNPDFLLKNALLNRLLSALTIGTSLWSTYIR